MTVLIKKQAVPYWRNENVNEKNNNERNCPLKSVQNKFKSVSSKRQLRWWEKQLHSSGNRIEKSSYIYEFNT